jgi:surface protein
MVSRMICCGLILYFCYFFFPIVFSLTIVPIVLSVRVVVVFEKAAVFNADISKWKTGQVTSMFYSTSTSVPHLFIDGVSIDFVD